MLGRSILHLGGVRVLLVGNDHVLDQVDHEQIAAVIQVARVADVNPAAGAARGSPAAVSAGIFSSRL